MFALLPCAIFGVINFGVQALFVILISVGSCYIFEICFNYIRRGVGNYLDFSSVVTGLIIAMILPVSVPLYIPVIAAFLAIVIFKGCFGGLGRNIVNPAAAARMVLGFIFAGLSLKMFSGTALDGNVASPLYYFMNGDYASITLRSMFFGTSTGAIGTVSIICILIAGIVLMCVRVIDFVIPISSVLTFVIATWIFKGPIAILPFLFTGSFMFVSMFMLPEPTTSPNTIWGKLVYGLLFGFIAGMFRVNFILGESSVFIALIIANLIAPLLDKIFAPRPLLKERRG